MKIQVSKNGRPVDATDLIVKFGQFQIAESAMSTDSVEVPEIDTDRFISVVTEAGYTITHIG